MLILSEETDRMTDQVCQWLLFYGQRFKRINREQASLYACRIHFHGGKWNIHLEHGGEVIDLDKVSGVWFRRGYLDFNFQWEAAAKLREVVSRKIYHHLQSEKKTLEDFIYFYLRQKKSVNDPLRYNCNKLEILFLAQKIGLRIPDTLVSDHKTHMIGFLRKNGKCISKNIQDLMEWRGFDDMVMGQGTIPVETKDLQEKSYGYSLFQSEIKKKYELRIFYWFEKCYTAAIFSQGDRKSLIESRMADVNGSRATRVIPFMLPEQIQKQLRELMQQLDMESSSIDMIVDLSGDFYFLEVNPVGQFHYVNELCNYHIDKQIAMDLKDGKS